MSEILPVLPSHWACSLCLTGCTTDDDDDGDIHIGGADNSDYDQLDDADDRTSSDTQERRMAPAPILTRPGLLAGNSLLLSCSRFTI